MITKCIPQDGNSDYIVCKKSSADFTKPFFFKCNVKKSFNKHECRPENAYLKENMQVPLNGIVETLQIKTQPSILL